MVSLYVVRDLVAEDSGPVFIAKNDGVAKRQFDSMMSREGVQPGDYRLLHVGYYDSDQTVFDILKVPVEVILTVSSGDMKDEAL